LEKYAINWGGESETMHIAFLEYAKSISLITGKSKAKNL
jgi:hypothetical protein